MGKILARWTGANLDMVQGIDYPTVSPHGERNRMLFRFESYMSPSTEFFAVEYHFLKARGIFEKIILKCQHFIFNSQTAMALAR